MSDLISRQEAIEKAKKLLDDFGTNAITKWEADYNAENYIKAIPSAEKVGRWIEKSVMWCDDPTFSCSVCGEEYELLEGTPIDVGMNYCPNCGAKMERSE